MASPIYRSRQVMLSLKPRLLRAEVDEVRATLTEGEEPLFFAMQKRDQWHALEVKRRLSAQGVNDRDLLVAALLHDCGKGAVPLWLRITKVLSPRLVRRFASAGSNGWRAAAYRLIHHAEIGARQANAAGSSSAIARLIAGEVLPNERSCLLLLRAADDVS